MKSDQSGARATKPKKAATLTMRLTQRTRDALEEVATTEGRSVSEVAERWLDAAQAGRANADALLGTPGLEHVFKQMVLLANVVREQVGDPATDNHARAALIKGLQYLPAYVVPRAKPSERETKLSAARLVLTERAGEFLERLKELFARNPEHPAIKAFTREPNALINALSYSYNAYSGRTLAEDLTSLADGKADRNLQTSIFQRLDAIEPDVWSGEVPTMEALVELMKAHTAYLTEWIAYDGRRIETLGVVYAYLEEVGAKPTSDLPAT